MELHGIRVSFLTGLLVFQDPQTTTLLRGSSQPQYSKDSAVLQRLAGFLSKSKRQHRRVLGKEYEASLQTVYNEKRRNFTQAPYPFTKLFTEPSRTFTDCGIWKLNLPLHGTLHGTFTDLHGLGIFKKPRVKPWVRVSKYF